MRVQNLKIRFDKYGTVLSEHLRAAIKNFVRHPLPPPKGPPSFIKNKMDMEGKFKLITKQNPRERGGDII